MNSMFKALEHPEVKEAWSEVMDVFVVEYLKEHYIMCLSFDDIETASAILPVLRYFSTYDEFKEFLKECADAGYADPRK